MRLDPKSVALAMANVMAAWFLLCGLLVKLAPEQTVIALYRALLHVEVSVRPFGWGDFLIGLVGWWAMTALVSGSAASLYNRTSRA